MSEKKLSWRTAFNPHYIGSSDLDGPISRTIAKAVKERLKTNPKSEEKIVIYFVEKELDDGEPMKPMILNATNCKFLQKTSGTKYFSDWAGIRVEIYVDPNTKQIGGGKGDGLKLREAQQKKEITPDKKVGWKKAKEAYVRDGSFQKVLIFVDISEANQKKMIEEIELEKSELENLGDDKRGPNDLP